MNSIYSGYREEAYVSLRECYEPGYRERNNRLSQSITYKGDIEEFLSAFVKDQLTILDWGGDTGANTPFAQRRVCLDLFVINGKDRKGVVSGKCVSESVSLGGRRIITKKKK